MQTTQNFPSLEHLGLLIALLLGSVFMLPTGSDSLFGLALLFMVVATPNYREIGRSLLGDPLLWCLGALLLLIAVSSLWPPVEDADKALKLVLRLIFALTFILVVAASARELPRFQFNVARCITLGILLSSAICIYWYLLEPPADGRMLGLQRFNNTGRAGRIIAASLPFIMTCLWLDRGSWRLLGLISLVVSCIALACTGTRSAWLAAAISVSLYALLSIEQRPKRIIMLLAILSLSAGAAGIWLSSAPELLAMLFPRGDSFRLAIWQGHSRDIMDKASLFGWGQLYDHHVNVGKHVFRGAHNMYLSVAGQIGLPGLALFLLILGWSAKRLFMNIHLSQARLGLSLLLAGSAALAFNGDRLIDKVNFVWFVQWFPIAVAISLGNKKRDSGESPGVLRH